MASIELIKGKSPKIILPFQVQMDIQKIVDSTNNEVGWIGECVHEGNDVYRVLNVFVPEQYAVGTTTEIYDEGLANIIDQHPEFDISKFRYWGHSHAKMGISPSSQDHKMMKEFAESCDFFVGTIHNQDGKIHGYSIDTTKGLFYDGIDVEVEYPDYQYSQDWAKIIKERVSTVRPYSKTTSTGKAYGGYGQVQYFSNHHYQSPYYQQSNREFGWSDKNTSTKKNEQKGEKELEGKICSASDWEILLKYYDEELDLLEKPKALTTKGYHSLSDDEWDYLNEGWD